MLVRVFRHDSTYVKQGQFNNFAESFELFFHTTQVFISDIGLLFNSHHRHGWINLRWQGDLDLILVAVDTEQNASIHESIHALTRSRGDVPNTHALFNVGGGDFLAETNNELCNLFHIDDVFSVLLARVDDLGASCNLTKADQKCD